MDEWKRCGEASGLKEIEKDMKVKLLGWMFFQSLLLAAVGSEIKEHWQRVVVAGCSTRGRTTTAHRLAVARGGTLPSNDEVLC